MIEILIGMIGSGKSTYSKQRAKEGAIICNDDAIVELLHGGNYRLYDKNIKAIYKAIESQIIHLGIAIGKDVVIDRTNLDIETRKRYVNIAKSLDIDIVATKFKVKSAEEHAQYRFKKDSRGHTYEKWLEVAKYHLSKYTQPSIEEGFLSIREYSS